jgi:hypothetical protein
VTVERAGGAVYVVSSYNPIVVRDVDGRCDIIGDSSPVSVRSIKGEAQVRTSYGEISASDIGGHLRVEGDTCPVIVDGVRGECRISNSYGYVIVKGSRSDVEIQGDSSPIEVSQIAALPAGGLYDLRTSYKRIQLKLPPDASADILAVTYNGVIDAEFPMAYDSDGVKKATATLGDGDCRIRLETCDDIYITKQR